MPEIIQQFLTAHGLMAPIIAVILRMIAVVLAPVPGTPMDLVYIALFGRLAGFLYALTGIMVGACLAFLISRKYGRSAAKKFTSLEEIDKLNDGLVEGRSFSTLVAVRFLTAPVFDYLSFAIGLGKMSFQRFFWVSLFGGGLALGIFYYLGGLFLVNQFYIALVVGISIMIMGWIVGKSTYIQKIKKLFVEKKGRGLAKIRSSWNQKNRTGG